jgi:hypothetical protein
MITYIPIVNSPSSAGGRPPTAFPRKSYNCQLSIDEIQRLAAWQSRFKTLMGKKVPRGEAIGILSWMLTPKLKKVQEAPSGQIQTFEEFLAIFLKSASEKRRRFKELSQTYPYLRMYTPSRDARPFASRPYPITPRRKNVSLRLTKTEANLLNEWAQLLGPIIGDELQRGEVVGLIAWIAEAQFEEIQKKDAFEFDSLGKYLELLEDV